MAPLAIKVGLHACFRYMAPLAIKVGLHACFRYMAPLAIKVGLHACFRYMAPLAIKVGLHAFSSYLEWGHRAHKVELPYPYTQGDTQYDSLHQEGTTLTENGRPQHSIPYLGTSSMFCQT